MQASGPGSNSNSSSSGSGARGPGHSPAKGPGGAAGTSADGRALELAMNAQSFRTAASPTPAKLQFLQKFIDDGPNGGLKEDVSELFAKFTMARSVLETFNDSGNTSDDILTLLDWATDMLALHADILACYHDGKVPIYTSVLLSFFSSLAVSQPHCPNPIPIPSPSHPVSSFAVVRHVPVPARGPHQPVRVVRAARGELSRPLSSPYLAPI